jgi:hypothetical protein
MQLHFSLFALTLLSGAWTAAAAIIALRVDGQKRPVTRILVDKLMQAALLGVAALVSLLTSLAAGGD